MDRRAFLLSSAAAAILVPGWPSQVRAQDIAQPAPAGEPFSFDVLTERMRARAGEPYQATPPQLPEVIANLGYDEHRSIAFRKDRAVWKGQSPFEINAFHMGWLFKEPVFLYSVQGGTARPMVFTAEDYEYRPPLDAARFQGVEMPGVAGFRLMYALNRPGVMDELVTFLGSSYFRALGRDTSYGLSARGLAVNTATQEGEEFPRFDSFYVEMPSPDAGRVTLWATLDSRSVTGAYQFVITPGKATQMEVTARLFLRENISRLGIAPLTSMFLFAENNRSRFHDYRNAVHDSDGLKIIRRNGEEVWRSLNNPARLATSFFGEENPKGFGLFQRDRAFENYQDAGAHYERRPSLLVEPMDDWGKGNITLIEIPTELEVNDNIVAFWVPEGDMTAGKALEYRYRLSWGALADDDANLARAIAVRGGHGGVSGSRNDDGLHKFVVDFDGGPLARLAADGAEIESTVKANNAEIRETTLSRIEANGHWRLVIDIQNPGEIPVELSAYLSQAGTRMSEIWLYQWRPDDDRAS